MRDLVQLLPARLMRWRPAFATLALAAIAVLMGVSGCSWSEKIKVAADGSPQYQNLQISYDLASTAEFKSLDQPPAIEQTAHFEPALKSPTAKPKRPWTQRRVHLEIQYPYPNVHPAFARATLHLTVEKKEPKKEEKPAFWEKPAPPEPKKTDVEPVSLPVADQADLPATDEILYIDIPKIEIDQVLAELAKADFFELPSNPDGESHLLVVYNKGQCEKGWNREEHLDRLIDLLRRHGAPLPAPAAEPKKS